MKKKIVFLIESLRLGGSEKSLTTLLQNLDYSRYEVDLVTFTSNGIFRAAIPAEVQQVVHALPMLSYGKRSLYYLNRKIKPSSNPAQLHWPIVQSALRPLPKKYDIAVAYSQGFATYYTDAFVDAERKYTWLNTDYVKAGFDIHFDYPVYANFDAIITVSNESKRVLEGELAKIKKSLPMQVISDIVDAAAIRQASVQAASIRFSGEVNILTVGRLDMEKGVLLALDSCRHLVEQGCLSVKWYLLGEGRLKPRIQKLIKKYNLENHIFLLNADPNPYPYMLACDIYVQPSLYEGMGLALIEAACLGKPIVSTDFPTAREVLEDGVSGLLAEFTGESIADQVRRIIQDRHLRESLQNNIAQKDYCNKEKVLAEIDALFG